MDHDTFVHKNMEASLLRYQYARKTLRTKAAELRPLRRTGRIPLWRDLETQFVRTALNRRRDYFEALRIRDAVVLVTTHRNEQIDRYITPHVNAAMDMPFSKWDILISITLIAAVAVFCALGECL